MASKTGELFKFIIIIQILFGFFITCSLYFLPTNVKSQVSQYTGQWTGSNAQDEQSKVENTYHSIRFLSGIPILGTLMIAIETGNIVVDLIANSLFALPIMASILIGGIFSILPISPFITVLIMGISFALCCILYILLLIGFLGGIRSGTAIMSRTRSR